MVGGASQPEGGGAAQAAALRLRRPATGVVMELTYEMGVGGLALVIAGSLVLGVVLQLIGDARFGYEWILTALGAFAGAMIASELIIGLQEVEPVWDGLALVPALVGGLIGGIVVAFIVRFVTGGSYLHGPRAV